MVRRSAGAPSANAVSAPAAPPVDSRHPVRASHAAIFVMFASTSGGVAREPMPA